MPERPKGANYEVKRPLLEVVGLKLSPKIHPFW